MNARRRLLNAAYEIAASVAAGTGGAAATLAA
jgi:hypothetical protein